MLIVLLVVSRLLTSCYGATHWLVTEDGKLQATDETLNTGIPMESYYNLDQPHDAVQFLRQEDRSRSAELAQADIDIHKRVINGHERKDDPKIEEKMMATDPDCIQAVVPLQQQDLFVSVLVPLKYFGYDEAIFLGKPRAPKTSHTLVPKCHLFYKLPFSMLAYEHLQGVHDRANLSMAPERNLMSLMETPWPDIVHFGHYISIGLKENPSSWVLHNLAVYYWRMYGDAYHAIECARGALHLTPNLHQTLPLLSLAHILHHSSRAADAAVVADALMDRLRVPSVVYCSAGRIYAAALMYNKSISALTRCIEINSSDNLAKTHLAAVKCHQKLEETLEEQHSNLQKTLVELQSYQDRLKKYQGLHELIKKNAVSTETKVLMNLAYDYNIYGPIDYCKCVLMSDASGKYIHCAVSDWKKYKTAREKKHQYLYGPKGVTKAPAQVSQADVDKEKAYLDLLESNRDFKMDKPTVNRAYPIINKSIFTPDDYIFFDESWPTKADCDKQRPSLPTWKNAPHMFMSPENKGVTSLLSTHLKLGTGEEHPLPWYPPFCSNLDPNDSIHLTCCDHLLGVQRARKRDKDLLLPEPELMGAFLNLTYPPSENVAELGQRIHTLLQFNVGPRWLLLNLAALYWRVSGVASESVSCLRQAIELTPKAYMDIPLVQLSQLCVIAGERVDDAIALIKQAIEVDSQEPIPRFLLFFYQLMKGDYKTSRATLKKALEYEPRLPSGLQWMKAIRCFMNFPHNYDTPPVVKEPLGPCLHNSMTSQYFCFTDRKGNDECYFEQTHVMTYAKRQYVAKKQSKSIAFKSASISKEAKDYFFEETLLMAEKPEICRSTTFTVPQCANPSNSIKFMFLIGKAPNYQSDLNFEAKKKMRHLIYAKGVRKVDEPMGEVDEDLDTHQDTKMGDFRKDKGTLKVVDKEISQALKDTRIPVGTEDDIPEVTLDYDNQGEKQFDESERSMAKAPPSKRTVQYFDGSLVQGTDGDPGELISQSRHETVDIEGIYKGNSFDAKVQDTPVKELTHESQDVGLRSAEDPPLQPLIDTPIPEFPPKPFDYQIRGGSHLVPVLPETPTECEHWIKRVKLDQATSTWLSVTAKGIKLEEYMDLTGPPPTVTGEPICPETKLNTLWTMDHLMGSIMRDQLVRYKPEKGLSDAFQNLAGRKDTLEGMAARLTRAMKKPKNVKLSADQEGNVHWTLTTVAGLYWRVKGNASRALTCLRHSLNNAPYNMRDLALVSVANVYHQSGLLHSALIAGGAAFQISPRFVVIHFTMANIYAALGMLDEAIVFYFSTLALQNNFDPARERINAIYCTVGRLPYPADQRLI